MTLKQSEHLSSCLIIRLIVILLNSVFGPDITGPPHHSWGCFLQGSDFFRHILMVMWLSNAFSCLSPPPQTFTEVSLQTRVFFFCALIPHELGGSTIIPSLADTVFSCRSQSLTAIWHGHLPPTVKSILNFQGNSLLNWSLTRSGCKSLCSLL